MSEFLLANASAIREQTDAANHALVVVGSAQQATFWLDHFAARTSMARAGEEPNEPRVVCERGRKGNFLGTLQAFDALPLSDVERNRPIHQLDQIAMFVGAGVRLSPITQALGNMKSAFPLPDPREVAGLYTIGDAAIRSGALLASSLHARGFTGLLVKWGDEVVVPSVDLGSSSAQYSDCDVVRFGWQAVPDVLLAEQKEWFLADATTGVVFRDLPRQPLTSLIGDLQSGSGTSVDTYVNLGTFAISQGLLEIACEVFQSYLTSADVAANWDPYFWVALQCDSPLAWDATVEREERLGRTGLRELLGVMPDFYDRVDKMRVIARERLGRNIRVRVFDLGTPYWLDIGNHESLRAMLRDVFSSGAGGRTLRALLGLPEDLATGESLVVDSTVGGEVNVRNSLVIGATIGSTSGEGVSEVQCAVVLGGRYDALRIEAGGAVIECDVSELTVHGPCGLAFRVEDTQEVAGNEVVATIHTPNGPVVLRYDDTIGTISGEAFYEPVAGNPISYAEAATQVAHSGAASATSANRSSAAN